MSKWKWALSLFAIVALGLFAVACGDDDDDDSDGGETPAASETADGGETPAASETADGGDGGDDEKMGGELTVHYVEHDSFDPHYSSFSQSIGVTGMVFRGLYNLAEDNSPVPAMAEGDPEVSDDGKTVTIKLKEGLVWSDGDDLTAEDFVAAFQRTCNFSLGGQYQYVLTNVVGCDEYYDAEANEGKPEAELEALREGVGVKAVDPTTLEISLENPQPTFPIILSMWMTWPVPTHIVTEVDQEWPQPQDLAFNGPFMVESYTPGSNIVLVRNDNYAGDHLAYLDKLTLQYIEDTETANNAFRNGELQMAVANTSALTSLQDEFPDELLSLPSASTIALQMNLEREPLGDVNVRLALSKAIDRETLNSVVLQGAHIPTTTWIPSDIVGGGATPDMFEDEIGFDPEGAAALLEEAGFPGGEGFPVLTILIRDTPSNVGTAEFLQQSFAEHLGIEVEIEIVDAPTRSARFGAEDFDLFPGGWIQDYPDPENWVWGLYDTDGGLNHYNCSDPRIDELVDLALYNENNEERLEQWREANEIISTTVCGGAPMYHLGNHYLISPEVGGARELSNSKDRVLAGDWIVEEWYVAN